MNAKAAKKPKKKLQAKLERDQLAQEQRERMQQPDPFSRENVKKMIAVLPAPRVVRYFQLESKMDAIFDYDLSQRIPLAR